MGDEPGWRERAEPVAARALAVVSFMDRVAKPPAGALARPGRMELLTYHSSQTTKVPDTVGPSDIVHVARAIVARKLDDEAQTYATLLVPDNPGFLLHQRGAADARGMKLRLAAVPEILAERLG